jgi:hypothetical protein
MDGLDYTHGHGATPEETGSTQQVASELPAASTGKIKTPTLRKAGEEWGTQNSWKREAKATSEEIRDDTEFGIGSGFFRPLFSDA